MPALLPLVTVIVSGIVYHLAQKASGGTNPWRMLTIAYGAAFALTALLALANRDPAAGAPARERAAGLLLGLSAFGIEAGFFFIYRAGWPLASASVIASITVTAILALVGVVVFAEPMSSSRALGLVMAAIAGVLIARGQA